MKPIDKFILHAVLNWPWLLTEAYSPKAVAGFLKKFKEEAEDLNYKISDKQLEAYINQFDKVSNKLSPDKRDLAQYNLADLVKIASKYKEADVKDDDEEEKEDDTPDVVYHQNGLIIYNGNKEQNCILYGKGEKWCITNSSWSTYRYDSNRKNPTFYLVKDEKLPNSNPKSFFVVVVGSDNTYKVSDRTNNDVGNRQTEWSAWESWSFVETEFPSIKGLHSYFKYIPIRKSELFARNRLSLESWLELTNQQKIHYIDQKSGSQMIDSIGNAQFLGKYVVKYPEVAKHVAANGGLFHQSDYIEAFPFFSPQDQNSIASNFQTPLLKKDFLSLDVPFKLKYLLTLKEKVKLTIKELAYVANSTHLVLLSWETPIPLMDIITEEQVFKGVKLNERTGKFLLSCPKLDDIPFSVLIKFIQQGALKLHDIVQILQKIEKAPKSHIVVNKTDKGIYVTDLTAFITYELSKNGELKQASPADLEQLSQDPETAPKVANTAMAEIQHVFNREYGRGTISTKLAEYIQNNISKIPFEKRILKARDANLILLRVPDNKHDRIAQALPAKAEYLRPYGNYTTIATTGEVSSEDLIPEVIPAWYKYLSLTDQKFNNETLVRFIEDTETTLLRKIIGVKMPLTDDCKYVPYYNPEYAQGVLLINKEEPQDSLIKHASSGNLNRKVLKPAIAQTLINQTQYRTAQVAQQPQAAQEPQAPQAATGVGNANVYARLTELGLAVGSLPRAITNRMGVGSERVTDLNTQRGVRDRNAVLGAAGEVTEMYRLPGAASSVYIIRMASGRMVAAITLQPGNYQILLTSNDAYNMGSATHLFDTLHQHGLNEGISSIMIKEFLVQNPSLRHEVKHRLSEFLKQRKS